MRVRPMYDDDIPALEALAKRTGYPYPDLNDRLVESVIGVVDENDQPVLAIAAKRLVELYLFVGEFEHPAAKMAALRLLHQAMGRELQALGYHSAEAFLPPDIEANFGKRLIRSFNFVRNWVSYCVHF